MRKVILFIILFLPSLCFSASYMRVKFTDGSFKDFKAEEIQNFKFAESSKIGSIQGHDCVDLGLSVKWATTNIGAIEPTEGGDKFPWGMTTPFEGVQINWENYAHCDSSPSKFTKYNFNEYQGVVDNLTVLESEDDAANTYWGKAWRMPTAEEVQELTNNCNLSYTANYMESGVAGVIVSSKMKGFEGNEIFIPRLPEESSLYTGLYWTASLGEEYAMTAKMFVIGNMYGNEINPNAVTSKHNLNYIRAVSDEKEIKGDSALVITLKDLSQKEYLVKNVSDLFFFDDEAESAGLRSGDIDGYEYIDLGLSTYWATYNVGAQNATETGSFLAWAETETRDISSSIGSYGNAFYKYMDKDSTLLVTKYCTDLGFGITVDNMTQLEAEDDAATVNWSSQWRMPTAEEMDELRTKCTWQWTDDYMGSGASGFLVTSTVPGFEKRSIFLIANGMIQYNYHNEDTESGYYWSSTLYEKNNRSANTLTFSKQKGCSEKGSNVSRWLGILVRAVSDK